MHAVMSKGDDDRYRWGLVDPLYEKYELYCCNPKGFASAVECADSVRRVMESLEVPKWWERVFLDGGVRWVY